MSSRAASISGTDTESRVSMVKLGFPRSYAESLSLFSRWLCWLRLERWRPTDPRYLLQLDVILSSSWVHNLRTLSAKLVRMGEYWPSKLSWDRRAFLSILRGKVPKSMIGELQWSSDKSVEPAVCSVMFEINRLRDYTLVSSVSIFYSSASFIL